MVIAALSVAALMMQPPVAVPASAAASVICAGLFSRAPIPVVAFQSVCTWAAGIVGLPEMPAHVKSVFSR